MPSTPATTSNTPPITEPAELEAFANLLIDSLNDVQEELDEAEAHLDYLQTSYRADREDGADRNTLETKQAMIAKATETVTGLQDQRVLVGTTLLSVLRQLPEED